MLGEYDANQTPIYETVYLGNNQAALPVGVMKQTGTMANNNITTDLYYVYADHIHTPRVITRPSDNAIVWRWDTAEVFGATTPDQNPNAIGTFAFNQRFPGQVADAETGLSNNWHRDYDARQGRYRQSDPIGLAGGINTYSYVGGNPLSYTDPNGLNPVAIGIGIGVRVVGGRVAAAAIGAGARRLLGPTVGGIAACVLAGVCTLNEDTKTPNDGEPDSCHVNPGSGQERKYGSDGKPDYDVDWDHDHGQGVPHGHNWGRGPNGQPVRGPGVPISPWPRGRGPGG
jgi:RHS repeat-associated protein